MESAKVWITKSIELFTEQAISTVNRNDFNNELYLRCLKTGNGLFVEELTKKLRKKKINLKLFSILEEEMKTKDIFIIGPKP